jgi:hypothetical protein
VILLSQRHRDATDFVPTGIVKVRGIRIITASEATEAQAPG